MNKNKANKTCTLQVRCTEEERKLLEKQAEKSGMKRSDYMRAVLFVGGSGKKNGAQIAVKAQEFLNHLEKKGRLKGKTEERMADEIWELLLSK